MKYIAAFMLAKFGGKENPSVEDIEEIIKSVGIKFDIQKAEEICEKLLHQNINDLINKGNSKLTGIFKDQTIQNQQHETLDEITENRQEENEEEEISELGIIFDDFFN